MKQHVAGLVEEIKQIYNSVDKSVPLDELEQKIARGIVLWADLDLSEVYKTLGISESHSELDCSKGVFLKTPLLQSLLDELCRTTLEDGLTKVYNRRYFERSLETELERSRREQRPCGLILLDIDFFKSFNDNYGHDVGDRVLRAVATTIKETLRSTDTISRVGGEEFAIIVPNTFNLDAATLAERIRNNVESMKFDVEDQQVVVTVSLGISINDPRSTLSVESFYKLADNALYDAKEAGRNCIRTRLPVAEKASSAVTLDERSELLG